MINPKLFTLWNILLCFLTFLMDKVTKTPQSLCSDSWHPLGLGRGGGAGLKKMLLPIMLAIYSIWILLDLSGSCPILGNRFGWNQTSPCYTLSWDVFTLPFNKCHKTLPPKKPQPRWRVSFSNPYHRSAVKTPPPPPLQGYHRLTRKVISIDQ